MPAHLDGIAYLSDGNGEPGLGVLLFGRLLIAEVVSCEVESAMLHVLQGMVLVE